MEVRGPAARATWANLSESRMEGIFVSTPTMWGLALANAELSVGGRGRGAGGGAETR